MIEADKKPTLPRPPLKLETPKFPVCGGRPGRVGGARVYAPARALSTLPSNFFRTGFPQARNEFSPTEPCRSLRPAGATENRWKPLFIGVFAKLQATFRRILAARPKCRAKCSFAIHAAAKTRVECLQRLGFRYSPAFRFGRRRRRAPTPDRTPECTLRPGKRLWSPLSARMSAWRLAAASHAAGPISASSIASKSSA